MNNAELQAYYDQQLVECKSYLESQLQRFKDANKRYLSAVIGQACERAKEQLELSNQQAFARYRNAQADIERRRQENCPERLLAHIIHFAKNDLERSLKFNRGLFEGSIAYYTKLLNE